MTRLFRSSTFARAVKCVVERLQIASRSIREDEIVDECHLYRAAASLQVTASPRVIDGYTSHQTRRHRQEMRTILPSDPLDIHQSHVGFVDKRGGLQAVAARSPRMQRFAIRCSSA